MSEKIEDWSAYDMFTKEQLIVEIIRLRKTITYFVELKEV